MRVPGRARPRLASSAAMPAARSCWPVVGDTLSMVACGVRDPGAFFQYELLYEYGGGRLYRRLAAGVSPAARGRVRPPGRPPRRAAGGVGLGAGGGLIRSAVGQAGGTDVTRRPGGVVVQVRGRTPRVVPVLARYHGRLLAAAAFAGEHLLTGGTDPARGNITNPVVASLAGGTGPPRLYTARLHATWLAETAALIGLPAFPHAAGIRCCQRLGDITAALAPRSRDPE